MAMAMAHPTKGDDDLAELFDSHAAAQEIERARVATPPTLGRTVDRRLAADPATIAAESTRRRIEIAAWLRKQIADPQTAPAVFDRAAQAVVDYGYPLADLENHVKATLRAHRADKIRTTRGALFFVRLRNDLDRHGLTWTPGGLVVQTPAGALPAD